MTTIVSITDFRKKIFDYADLISEKGFEVEVERNGKKVFKITKPVINAKERAIKALVLAKKLGGSWKGKKSDNTFFRGKKEIEYTKGLGDW